MIEINLNPSAKKKKARASTSSSSGPKFDAGAFMGNLTSRFKDPWLLFAIGGAVVGIVATGGQWYLQDRQSRDLAQREQVAVQDSARYAAVVAQRQAAEAQRDSINRQIAVITALDGDRFVWPHIMDEVSKALPTYTWLRSIAPGSAPAAVPTAEAVAEGAPVPKLSIRVIGITVDVQALTIFMKQLEASPFLEGVTLAISEVANIEQKQVTEFTLDMSYTKPDPSVIRTVPLSVAAR